MFFDPNDHSCWFCDNPGRKKRVQLSVWQFECIYVCNEHLPRIGEAIQYMRSQL